MQTPLYLRIYCATMSMKSLVSLGLVTSLVFGFSSQAQAQSSCSSDGQDAPTAVLERFISADCDTCWAKASLPQPTKGQIALDWIVPSPKGDDAALSAAASRDAQARLQALSLPWEAAKAGMQSSAVQKTLLHSNTKAAAKLRVAHGLPFNGYIGASIEFTLPPLPGGARPPSSPPQGHDLFAHLVLVETLPAGAEGSDVERNLVRNVLITPWRMADELGKVNKEGFKPFFESRPISIPAGVNPERLRVLGWVQDASGRILASAQSRCEM
jgi:hypothetical protein